MWIVLRATAPAPSVSTVDADDTELALCIIELDAALADCAGKLSPIGGLVEAAP